MQLAGKLNENDLAEVRAMIRTKSYWPKLLLRSWYGIFLFAALVWATAEAASGAMKPNWPALGVMWLVVIGIVAWSSFRRRRGRGRQFDRVSAALPDWVSLTDEGVKTDGPSGATSFHPWSSFKSWREGTRVILLEGAGGSSLTILPVGDLSEAARQPLRDLLRSHITTPNTPS